MKPGDTRKTYEALSECLLGAAVGDRSDRETVQFTEKGELSVAHASQLTQCSHPI